MATGRTSTILTTLGGGLAGYFIAKGQAHRKADQWTPFQTEWGDKAAAFVDALIGKRKAGTLTYDESTKALEDFDLNVGDLWDQATLFEGLGGDQKKVIRQAHTTLDPILASWRAGIQSHIDALKPPEDPGPDEAKPPGTPADADARAKAAGDRVRKRAMGADGRQRTILTGYTAPAPSTQRTILTGY